MKKNKLSKLLGFATVSLLSIPVALGLSSSVSTNTFKLVEEGSFKTLFTGQIFTADYKTELSLYLTNNLNLVNQDFDNTVQRNSLSVYAKLDFSQAIEATQMQSHALTAFNMNLLIVTSNGNSALQDGMTSTLVAQPIDSDPLDFTIELVYTIPPFDSYYNAIFNYATTGNLDIASASNIQTATTKFNIGTSFDSKTRIYMPMSVINTEINNWNQNNGVWGHDGVSAKVYVDPQTLSWFSFVQRTQNNLTSFFSGSIVLKNASTTYLVDLGSIIDTREHSISNNSFKLNFLPSDVNINNISLYNPLNGKTSPLTSVPDLTSFAATVFITYNPLSFDNQGYDLIQLANPINLTGVSNENLPGETMGVVATAPSNNENNGSVELTNDVTASMVNNYTTKTEINTTINASKTKTLGYKTLSLNPTVLSTSLEGLSVGFYNVTFELKNNNISTSSTVYTMSIGELQDADSLIPLARISTNFNITRTSITSNISFLGKEIGGEFTTLNTDKSMLNIYYQGELIDSVRYYRTSLAQNTTVPSTYTTTFVIGFNEQINSNFISFSTTLYYDTVSNGNIKTTKMSSNLKTNVVSDVAPFYAPTSSSMSAGVVAGIVVGSLALLALAVWVVSIRNLNRKQRRRK